VGDTTDVGQILKNVTAANKDKTRIFVLGVGSKVNTRLLDRLADDNHGNRDYVTENEDLEIKLSNFYTSLAHPVLSGIKLAFEGITVHDVYPKTLPDLFKGSELVVYGRYSGSGHANIRLTGLRSDTKMLFGFEAEFPASELANDFVPRLWARAKIGHLMDQIRLHGSKQELKDEVVRLSKKYGIMTELTSWLVLEDTRVRPSAAPVALRRALNQPMRLGMSRRGRAAFDAQTGAESVRASEQIARMKAAGVPRATSAGRGGYGGGGGGAYHDAVVDEAEGKRLRDAKGAQVMRIVGAKTFYRDGERWVDSVHATAKKPKPQTVKIKLYSDEYFELTRKHPEAAKYLALGPRVVVVLDGKAYETVES